MNVALLLKRVVYVSIAPLRDPFAVNIGVLRMLTAFSRLHASCAHSFVPLRAGPRCVVIFVSGRLEGPRVSQGATHQASPRGAKPKFPAEGMSRGVTGVAVRKTEGPSGPAEEHHLGQMAVVLFVRGGELAQIVPWRHVGSFPLSSHSCFDKGSSESCRSLPALLVVCETADWRVFNVAKDLRSVLCLRC